MAAQVMLVECAQDLKAFHLLQADDIGKVAARQAQGLGGQGVLLGVEDFKQPRLIQRQIPPAYLFTLALAGHVAGEGFSNLYRKNMLLMLNVLSVVISNPSFR